MLIVILSLLVIFPIVFKAFLPNIKGYIGEERIRRLLEGLGQEYIVFNDLYVPKKNGKLTQIDHLVISPYGIFVIETKNYTGWIFGGEQQRNWIQTIYQKKSRFYNPIMQNKTHLNALKHYLDMDIPMYSIIVFSNAATLKFKEPFHSAKVIQNKQVKRIIKGYNNFCIADYQLSIITQLIQALVPTSSHQKKLIKKQHLADIKRPVRKSKAG